MKSFNGYVWNYVHVGNVGAPESHCGNAGGQANTTIEKAPLVVEKPYIIASGSSYKLMVPNVETDKVGTTPGWENATEVDFSEVFVASESDSAATINAKLAEGLHLLLQPGNYKLDDSIKVTRKNTVVLGIGLATLIANNGEPAIEVSNVDGVKISGVLLQAGPV